MRKVRCSVCRVDDLQEGVGRVLPLGDNGGDCAMYLIDGRVFATGSLCPHQNSSLERSEIEQGEIVCRRHGFRFDPKSGDCLTIGGYGLPVFEVDVEEGTVFVSYWEFDD